MSVHTFPLASSGWISVVVRRRNLPAPSYPPARRRHHPKILQQQGQRPHGVCGQGPQKPSKGDLRHINADNCPVISSPRGLTETEPKHTDVLWKSGMSFCHSCLRWWQLLRNLLKNKKWPEAAGQRTWEGWSDWMRTLWVNNEWHFQYTDWRLIISLNRSQCLSRTWFHFYILGRINIQSSQKSAACACDDTNVTWVPLRVLWSDSMLLKKKILHNGLRGADTSRSVIFVCSWQQLKETTNRKSSLQHKPDEYSGINKPGCHQRELQSRRNC